MSISGIGRRGDDNDSERPTDIGMEGRLRRDISDTMGPPEIRARLVLLVGDEVGKTFSLHRNPCVIGRDERSDIRLTASDVSRSHASIEWTGDAYELTDLGSRNGTRVNGLPAKRCSLRFGDRLSIGINNMLIFTHHDELETRAQQLQKMDALGKLAGTVAHDFNNMLSIVLNNLDYMAIHVADQYTSDKELRDAIFDSQTALANSSQQLQRLLSFARRSNEANLCNVQLACAVADTVELLRRSFTEKIRFSVDISPTLVVMSNQSDLQQVLVNLCINARDAMPDGGELVIAASHAELDSPTRSFAHYGEGEAFVELVISDTGIGMTELTLTRAMEPFFTTKVDSNGTGLGLASVYGIVRSQGGTIQISSTLGKGTQVRLFLPTGGVCTAVNACDEATNKTFA